MANKDKEFILSKRKTEKVYKSFIISIIDYISNERDTIIRKKAKIEYMGDLIDEGKYSIKETKSGEKYYIFD